jgi:heptosyltransferase-3
MASSEDCALPAPVRRIVVVRPNHRLGNALLLTPLIQQLETSFPGSEIEVVTTGVAAHAVFQQFIQVTAVTSFPIRSYRHPARVLGLMMKLRQRSYDLAIDPSLHSRAGRFLLGLLRARVHVGYAWGEPGRDRMLTHAVNPELAPAHCAQSPLFLLRSALGRCVVPHCGELAKLPLDLRLTASERLQGRHRLAIALNSTDMQTRPSLGVFAHATGGKRFPVEWWRGLIAKLRSQLPTVQIVEFMPADGRARLGADLPALHTPDLRVLGATLAATSLVAIADCGVMHLADAAGARVLGLFKTTEPSRYGPRGPSSEAMWVSNEGADAVAARIRAVLQSPARRPHQCARPLEPSV